MTRTSVTCKGASIELVLSFFVCICIFICIYAYVYGRANLCEHQAMKLIEILGRVDCFRYSWKCRLIAYLKKVRVMDEDEVDKSITES